MEVTRIGVVAKVSSKSIGGRPPRVRYPDGPETSRRIARLKYESTNPSLYMVVKRGL